MVLRSRSLTRLPWIPNSYVNIEIVVNWGLTIFILTMQAILLIRVYALFNRSKKVLIFPVTFYVLQATAIFVMTALMYNKQAQRKHIVSVGPAVGSVAQSVNENPPSDFLSFIWALTILPVAFDTILLFYALWAFVRHTLEAKRLHGGWSINVLVRTMMADHLIYFFCFQIWMVFNIAPSFTTNEVISQSAFICMLSIFGAFVVIFGPYVIINLRETEKKTRGEGGTVAGEVSTIRFGARELPTQSESIVEEGEGFRVKDEHSE
ncbi:hypothetical protein BJ138DRAFT_575784 [Hygrophoropsis aurantiaca]|uniref:Uncharacterized protein n=1 Tax=Hygrophoropsis aurantiaca TaxID=72124 RepID=A0ACB8A134_9AGAM|nr:hypothetical protein BJ138DRAFT_575784 [Hygrophoropsis aurantiaca]